MAKEMKIDSPEFKKVQDCSDQLGKMIIGYMAENELNVPHGLSVMAAATINVIETLCSVINENPHDMLDVYIDGLRAGGEDDFKAKGV